MGTKLNDQKFARAGGFLAQWLWYPIKLLVRIISDLGPFVVRLIGIVVVLLMVLFFLLDTKRDVAYRYSAPDSPACKTQQDNLTALAEAENNETSPKLNAEIKSHEAFTCMLQKHALRSVTGALESAGNPSLTYYLSFLEFQENGEPAQYGVDKQLLRSSQLDVLLDHLKKQQAAGKQNFVFIFIHG
jgi:hypothetical protein